MPKRPVAPQSNNESTIKLANLPSGAFCHTGYTCLNKKVVWTGGPNTCIILFARTRHTLLCWHFASMDALDAEKMEMVKRQLDGLPLRGASFFLLPGADRDPGTSNPTAEAWCSDPTTIPQSHGSSSWNSFASFHGLIRLNSCRPQRTVKNSSSS